MNFNNKKIFLIVILIAVVIFSFFIVRVKNISEIKKFSGGTCSVSDGFNGGTYYARFFSPEGKDQLLTLYLSPFRYIVSPRASLKISFSDGSSFWKIGNWGFSEDGSIVVSFSGSSENGFLKEEVLTFLSKNNLLVATQYDKRNYDTKNLQFFKENNFSELVDFANIILCGKKVKIDKLEFGYFNFTKVIERIVGNNSSVDLCNRGAIFNSDDYILGLNIKELYLPKTNEGVVSNKYIVTLYSKKDMSELDVFEFDFDSRRVFEQVGYSDDFRSIGVIKDDDFGNGVNTFSVVGSLYLHFRDVDNKYLVKKEVLHVAWNDGDGYHILVPAKESFIIAKQNAPLASYKLVADTYFKQELSVTDAFLKNKGFVLDKLNSSTTTLDTSFYDYVQSYRKNNELCTVLVNPDFSSLYAEDGHMAYNMSVACSDKFDESKKEQLPFLEALNYKDTSNFVRLRNKSGDFYQVGVGSYRAGSTAILKKENGSYRVLYISQEDPSCEEIEKENIPEETLKLFKINGCFDDKNGYVRF